METPLSADAKVWLDEEGWHGIADFMKDGIDLSYYDLTTVLRLIEEAAEQSLAWEIFQFDNGLGLRGYIAR